MSRLLIEERLTEEPVLEEPVLEEPVLEAPAAPAGPGATVEHLLAAVAKHYPDSAGEGSSGQELVRRALTFVAKARSDEPKQWELGLRSALALAEMRLDPPTLAAALVVPALT